MTEICHECGQPVRTGLDGFVNRVVYLRDYKTRKEMNKPRPSVERLCARCQTASDGQPGKVLRFPAREEEETR